VLIIASVTIGAGLRTIVCCSLPSGDDLGGSWAERRENAESPNNACGLSWDPDRLRAFGGGGKIGFVVGSGEARYILFGGDRAAGDIPEDGSSAIITEARLLRGGE
jgi:hypothetical protein